MYSDIGHDVTQSTFRLIRQGQGQGQKLPFSTTTINYIWVQTLDFSENSLRRQNIPYPGKIYLPRQRLEVRVKVRLGFGLQCYCNCFLNAKNAILIKKLPTISSFYAFVEHLFDRHFFWKVQCLHLPLTVPGIIIHRTKVLRVFNAANKTIVMKLKIILLYLTMLILKNLFLLTLLCRDIDNLPNFCSICDMSIVNCMFLISKVFVCVAQS